MQQAYLSVYSKSNFGFNSKTGPNFMQQAPG